METIDLSRDDEVVALTNERDSLVARAASLSIKTAAGYEESAGWLRLVKGALKKIEDARNRVKGPIIEAGRAIDAQAKEAAAPWLEAEAKIKTALLSYQNEQERIQREEQRRLNEIAERERRELAARAAEAARKANEEAAAKRRAAEEAAAAGRAAEAARLAAQADKIVEKAEAKVETFESRAAQVVAPVVDRTPPKVESIKTREVWRFDVVDAAAIPREYLIIDESRIRKVVQAMKGDTRIAGVRVFAEKQLSAGAA